MDFASQTEEVHTDVASEKGTSTKGHGWSTHPHQQGVVIGRSQGGIGGRRLLLPEHAQGVLLVATGLTRERNGWDIWLMERAEGFTLQKPRGHSLEKECKLFQL